jgi:ribosome-binding protein aMBF1 (putative translation factor)
MSTTTLTLEGREYAIVPMKEYRRLLSHSMAPVVSESELPPMPKRLADGNYPALESLRVSMARDIITSRKAAGLSQTELARHAGIRVETLNRIEKAKVMPDEKTVAKIEKAISIHTGLAQARAGKLVKGPDLKADRKFARQLRG